MNNGLYTQSCGDIAAAVQKKRMDERKYSDSDNAKQCATEQYQTQGLAGCTMPKTQSVSEELYELRGHLGEIGSILNSISDIVLGSYPREEPGYGENERNSLIAHASQCKEIALSLCRISSEIKSAL